MLQLRPILSSLQRHKVAAFLIIFEIALTCTIVCNAVFVIVDRFERTQFSTGLAEDELVYLRVGAIGAAGNAQSLTSEDLAALRAVPGVLAASLVNQFPFGPGGQSSGLGLQPNQATSTISVATYLADVGLPRTFGLRLVAGRDFKPDETVTEEAAFKSDDARVPTIIVSRATAERLFPGQSALGHAVYVFGDAPSTIVGVVDRLSQAQPERGEPSELLSIIAPVRPTFRTGVYVLRVDAAQRDAVLKRAEAALDRPGMRRIEQEHGRLDELRATYYRADISMAWLLGGVCVALLAVTAFGIVGLASFWVQQRTQMIGTRRTLGATRRQIRHYFQLENMLLTTTGIVIGMAASYGVNQWLMMQFEMPRLPLLYLPWGAGLLLALGQLAVWFPARRAAEISPAFAMRGLTSGAS